MIPASETYEAIDAPEALGVARDAADHPALRWFAPATGALVALGWTISVYIQPASADLLRGRVTPLLGVLYAGFTAVSTVMTSKSGAIREQVGAERWIHRHAPVGLGAVYALSFLSRCWRSRHASRAAPSSARPASSGTRT